MKIDSVESAVYTLAFESELTNNVIYAILQCPPVWTPKVMSMLGYESGHGKEIESDE